MAPPLYDDFFILYFCIYMKNKYKKKMKNSKQQKWFIIFSTSIYVKIFAKYFFVIILYIMSWLIYLYSYITRTLK